MKILVTGGAGFIGSHIVDKLVERNHQVVVVDDLSTGKMHHIHSKAVFYHLDISSGEDMQRVFAQERPQYVIHQAAQINVQKSLRDPNEDARTNIIGTINVLECCREFEVQKIIYASSAAVYGVPQYLNIDEDHEVAPISPYGITKHTPEHFFQAYHLLYGLKYTILRYANVYGIRQDPQGEGGVTSIFISKLLRHDRPVIYGDGKQTRDFIYVTDVAEANIAALHNGDNRILNVSSQCETSVLQILDILNQVSGTSLQPIHQAERMGDIKRSCLSHANALRYLDWTPKVSLYEGLTKTMDYYSEIQRMQPAIHSHSM